MSEQKGVKKDQGKPRLDLIPEVFSIGVAKGFGFGLIKYSEDNFRLGLPMRKLLAAAKRHIELEQAGIEKDKESGLEHWMLAACSLAMYSFMKRFRPDMDNRYKYSEEEKRIIEEEMYGPE